MKKIIVAPDSFKGSLTSAEVADAVERGIKDVFPQCNVVKAGVADGGEGTVEAIVKAVGGDMYTASVTDPLGRPIKAAYGIVRSGGVKTAVMEMSAASGLPLLLPDELNPWITSTYGTGEMISDALNRGCRKFLVGIGGSATNDAGTGMLSALGVRFLDSRGQRLKGCGRDLESIARIDMSSLMPAARESEFIVACDVNTPFCGPDGAARVFAPQKGANHQTTEALDRGMRSFAQVIAGQFQTDIVPLSGAGAAGGLGGAFKAFLNARLTAGIEMVLDAIAFDSLLEGASLVITGEGRIDAQTAAGKTAAGVLRHAARKGIPVIAIGGSVAMCRELKEMGFIGIDPQIAAESLHSHGAAVVGQDHDLHTRRPHIGEPAAQVRVRLRLGLGCQGIVQIAQQQPDAVPHKKRGRDAAVAVKHPVGRHGNGHRYPTPLIKYSSIVPRTSWSRKGVRLCS